jgi:sulfur carrier protein ThiS
MTNKYKRRSTMKIEIYDPAMCCSTGVCGPSVDPELVRIQDALRQIQKQAPEVVVQRFGLSADPQAFVANAAVSGLLKSEGPECLPVVFVDGEVVTKGRYPNDEQIQAILKGAGVAVTLGEKKKSACKCGPGCC